MIPIPARASLEETNGDSDPAAPSFSLHEQIVRKNGEHTGADSATGHHGLHVPVVKVACAGPSEQFFAGDAGNFETHRVDGLERACMRFAVRALDCLQAGVVGNAGHVLPDLRLKSGQLAFVRRLARGARRHGHGDREQPRAMHLIAHLPS